MIDLTIFSLLIELPAGLTLIMSDLGELAHLLQLMGDALEGEEQSDTWFCQCKSSHQIMATTYQL